jgi:hypothetical protein
MSIFEEMMKQYESSHNGKRDSGSQKTYDLKNYFNTILPKGVNSETKRIRILPPTDGSKTPFDIMWGHVKKINGEWKTFPCLKHEKGEECPFCQAREALLATGKDDDKELAKQYSARQFYVVKVIDRDKEHEGVKFWRFKHNYKKQGVFDKIIAAIAAVNHDVTDIESGRDLNIVIVRDGQSSVVQSVSYPLETSKLSENPDKVKEWSEDTRTWEDVYSVRNYDYLKIVVKGDTPVWDKEDKCYIGKLEFESKTKSPSDEDDSLEEELEIGLTKSKTVKTLGSIEIVSSDDDDDDDDDLPF